jgi:hypothetical protein
MKFYDCFLFFWTIFALLNPDPDCKSESRDPIVSVSTTLRIIVKNWIRIRKKCQNSLALEAQNRAVEGHGHSQMEAWRLKEWSLGGSIDHWSQIFVTLMRSSIRIRI